jgi:hypothetical protein
MRRGGTHHASAPALRSALSPLSRAPPAADAATASAVRLDAGASPTGHRDDASATGTGGMTLAERMRLHKRQLAPLQHVRGPGGAGVHAGSPRHLLSPWAIPYDASAAASAADLLPAPRNFVVVAPTALEAAASATLLSPVAAAGSPGFAAFKAGAQEAAGGPSVAGRRAVGAAPASLRHTAAGSSHTRSSPLLPLASPLAGPSRPSPGASPSRTRLRPLGSPALAQQQAGPARPRLPTADRRLLDTLL